MTTSAMRRTCWRWALAAVFSLGGLWSASAAAQVAPQAPAEPTRLIVQPGGEAGVYVVTGTQPDVIPPAAPPVANAAIPGATTPAAAVACDAPAAGCATGKCGRHGDHCGKFGFCQDCGPRVSFCEVLGFHWCCCKAPATVPPPLGANVRTANDVMRSNALGEYFVVYREDWLANTANLNESGERHLGGIIRRLGMAGAPVKVEPSGIPALDALRRAAVSDMLIQAGVPPQDAIARVVVGGTRAEGLRDASIEALYFRGATIYSGGMYGGGGYGGAFGGGGGIYFPAYAGVGRY
jgi:hypothetical protein